MIWTKIINWIVRVVFTLFCKIDKEALRSIPREGPLILVGNHINFLEAPVVFPVLDNPNVKGIAKIETWKNPLFSFLFDLWGFFPIERGMVDRDAFRKSFEVLDADQILAVSPEGTRSGNGKLVKAKPGVVALAVKSKAPILPVAFYGYEDFWQNFKRFKRTNFHVVVGEQFRIDTNGTGLSKEVREIVTDEIMFKIAELLPEVYHGYYQNPQAVKYQYLVKA